MNANFEAIVYFAKLIPIVLKKSRYSEIRVVLLLVKLDSFFYTLHLNTFIPKINR